MLFRSLIASAALVGSALAQRPANTSICDFYTTALLTDNNATNQYTLLTLIVNTVVIGNYTQPNKNAVPGILASNATFNGTKVNLVPYFSGGFVSTNQGGKAVSTNFLDGGGAAPLKQNKPANDMTSNQYFLLTHLYSFFGGALGCSTYGMSGFPAYAGGASMYTVHKFMALDSSEVGYFIEQVGLAAASFGVTNDDVTAVGNLLTGIFDVSCGPPTTVIPADGPQLQSICTDPDCTQSANATCSMYDTFPGQPANASSSSASGTATSPAGSKPTSSSGADSVVLGTSLSLLAGVMSVFGAFL